MPIYRPEEYDAVLQRIREEVQAWKISLGPVLSEEELADFEAAHQIRLPEAYRRFLLEVGDGGDMFNGFELLPLNAPRERSSLSEPFPWRDYQNEPFSPAGTLELIDIGCCQTFQLIVTGPCRGEVWHFCEMGVQPCCQRQDFLGWFERWLTDGDRVDYFAEFDYGR